MVPRTRSFRNLMNLTDQTASAEIDRLDGLADAADLEGPFRVIPGPNRGCSVLAESGAELVLFAPLLSGEHETRAVLAGEEWEFRIAGTRRLRILGRPLGAERASVGFVGASSSGLVLLGEERRPYRLRKPLFRRRRIEDPTGEPLIVFHFHYFPRFAVSYHFVGDESGRSAVVPLLSVLACLTVLSVAKPSIHWTTMFAGVPAHARKRLADAMAARRIPERLNPDPLAPVEGAEGPEGTEEPGTSGN